MNAREFKEKLRRKELLVGFTQMLPSPQITELVGYAGYDWLFLDLEHGTTGFGTELENCIRAAEVSGMVSLIRVTDPAADWMYMRVLEAGANGVIVPRVRTADDVIRAVRQVKFPPMGEHGLCQFGRRWKYGLAAGATIYGVSSRANEETIIAVLIEQKEAMDNLDGILSVEGLDFAIWGPFDMLLDMGYLDAGREKYEKGLKVVNELRQKMMETCARKGVPFEEHFVSAERAGELIGRACTSCTHCRILWC